MKPRYAKECSRFSHLRGSEDKHYATFDVKFGESKDTHYLKIRTTEDGRKPLTFSIDHGEEVICEENSWINALLSAASGHYCAARPREFELHCENGAYWYALTEASVKLIMENYHSGIRHLSSASTVFAVPGTNPGQKFPDIQDELPEGNAEAIPSSLLEQEDQVTPTELSSPTAIHTSASTTEAAPVPSYLSTPTASATSPVIAEAVREREGRNRLPTCPPPAGSISSTGPSLTVEDIKTRLNETARVYLTRNPSSETYVDQTGKPKAKAICGVTTNFIGSSHGGPGVRRAKKFTADLEKTNDPKKVISIIRILFKEIRGDWDDQNSLKRMVCDELLLIVNSVETASIDKRSKVVALNVLKTLENGLSAINGMSPIV